MTALSGLLGFKSHGPIAKPGYSIFLIPWSGTKTATGITTRTQASDHLGGGRLDGSLAQNDEFTLDIWLDDGTYKYAQINVKSNAQGIYSVQLDGSEKGTIDGYAASPAPNTYTEITGVALTKGIKVFKIKMATKNASSSNYGCALQSSTWIRTGA